MSTSPNQPAAATSAIAARSRATSSANAAFVAMTTDLASIACAAISAPSITAYGLSRMIVRSLNVPGSPSAALTTTDVRSNGEANDLIVRHFSPVGKPAPPRPRRPDAANSPMIVSASTARAAVETLAAAGLDVVGERVVWLRGQDPVCIIAHQIGHRNLQSKVVPQPWRTPFVGSTRSALSPNFATCEL